MRMLFTALPAAGHIRPLIPVAHAAMRAGHEVTLCAPDSAKFEIEAYGLTHLPGGIDWLGDELRTVSQLVVPETATPVSRPEAMRQRFNEDLTAEGLAGAAALALARDVLAAADTWRPDLVVRENTEFGGYLAAEVLDVPCASVAVGGGKAHQLAALLAAALDRHRRTLGLPPDPTGARVHAYLHVSLVPPAYHASARMVPNTRYYRQTNPLRPDDALPGWLTGARHDGRPTLFAAFGTILPVLGAFDDTMDAIVAGLAETECTAVVAVGSAKLPGTTRCPANVRLVESVPQPLMLECCDLFINHGGFNSVREALRLGVPMVIVPWLTDSHRNAERCAELGAAAVVPFDVLTAERLRDACAEVLGEPGYRRRARAMQREMLALPGMDVLVRDLCALVAG